MDPLANGVDSLNGNHANTHLPEVIGVARGWEVEGNATLKNITKTFYKFLSSDYMYATGGSNVNEYWASLSDNSVTSHHITPFLPRICSR